MIPYGVETRIDGFIELFAPLALKPAEDTLALVEHDPRAILGRTRSGTLRLTNEPAGLSFEVDLPPTRAAEDLLALVERNDIAGASFAFAPIRETWEGRARRIVHEARLFEVSAVASPAYSTATVSARAAGLGLPPRIRLARRYLDAIAP